MQKGIVMFLDNFIDLVSYFLNSDLWHYFFLPAFAFSVIIIFSQMIMGLVRWFNV